MVAAHNCRRLLLMALLAVLAPVALTSDFRPPGGLAAGGDGVGSLPKTAGQTSTTEAKFQTLGVVIDAVTRQPVANTLIVVTDSTGHLAALAVTDADGLFTVYLFAEEGLELSIPGEGVAGLPIEAGDLLTIFVP